MKVKNLGAFVAHSLFIWAMYWLSLYLCFFSLPETCHLSIMDALVLLMLGSIAVAAPIPGGLGLYQKLIGDALMLLYFINAASANAFPWIVWGSQFIMIVSVGLISLVLLTVLNKSISNPVEKK
jgi:glycosyltransferase 2 family protein